MPAILSMHAAAAPERAMITCDERTITRGEFDRRTNRLARDYARLGVREGELVTIALPNGIEFYEAAMAVWKLGATPQPVSAKLPQAELSAIIELARPSLIVGGAEIQTSTPHLPEGYEASASLSDAPLEERIARHWRAPTSGGSTGRPKLIVSKQPAMFDPEAPFMEMRRDQVQLVPGPLYHNAPFSLSSIGLTRGHHLIVMPRFEAQKALELIERWRVNWLVLVPTMMSRIMRLEPGVRSSFDLSPIETLWHMAAPCPVWLKEQWIEWLGADKIWELYGGTEGQGITTIGGIEWLKRKGSVGKPSELFIMKALDDQGRELPPGEVGEIYMAPTAGPGTTYHYIGADPKATADGFESLGDMGWFDEDGYLYLVDRQTDMILSGGANIYPAEVEAAIEAHPAVRSCAVIGLPDDDLGSRVHAIVDAPEPVNAEDLLGFVGTRLARYKIPRSVEFVDAPLRDDAGKVRRSALRTARLRSGDPP